MGAKRRPQLLRKHRGIRKAVWLDCRRRIEPRSAVMSEALTTIAPKKTPRMVREPHDSKRRPAKIAESEQVARLISTTLAQGIGPQYFGALFLCATL